MINYDLLNQENKELAGIVCPNCQGVGRVKKSGELIDQSEYKHNGGSFCSLCSKKVSYTVNKLCYECAKLNPGELPAIETVGNMPVSKLPELIIQCIRDWKKQDQEAAQKKYDELCKGQKPVMSYIKGG